MVAILNSSGTAVVEYSYDAWGGHGSTSGTMSSTLGKHNPLRYRGYVYDQETDLYYLQSRYYNPRIGRFINADAYVSTGQGFTGNNMFAYCGNNPVSLKDSTGNSAALAGGIVGGIFGGFNAWISEISDDKEEDGVKGVRWEKVWRCAFIGATTGAAAGFVADVAVVTLGAALAMLASAGGGMFFSGINSYYTQITLYGEHDWKKTISDAIIGGFANALCTGMSDYLKPIVTGVQKGIQYASAQAANELVYGLINWGYFGLYDFLPTFITGFGSWLAGMEYDELSSGG